MKKSTALGLVLDIASEHMPYTSAEAEAHSDCRKINDEYEDALVVVDNMRKEYRNLENN